VQGEPDLQAPCRLRLEPGGYGGGPELVKLLPSEMRWPPGKPGVGQVQSTCPAENRRGGGGDALPVTQHRLLHSVHHPLS
jgi:hypothetical protein